MFRTLLIAAALVAAPLAASAEGKTNPCNQSLGKVFLAGYKACVTVDGSKVSSVRDVLRHGDEGFIFEANPDLPRDPDAELIVGKKFVIL